MLEEKELIIDKLRFLLVGVLMIASLLLLFVFASVIDTRTTQVMNPGTSVDILNGGITDNPNMVATVLSGTAKSINQTVESTDKSISSTFHAVAYGGAHTGAFVAGIGRGVAHGAGAGLLSVSRVACSSAAFFFRTPGDIVSSVSNAAVVSALAQPADRAKVPAIGVDSTEFVAAKQALPAPEATQASAAVPVPNAPSPVPQWPIHGIITTRFGVPEPPYQPIHTGLDISDGKRRGTTPIHPFKPGKVVQVIHSRLKLGNEVVVDHGGGITSVYGHMNSTAVEVGQNVDQGTILGYEGTTGVSTGVHLHFEVRVNGIPQDPHKFISGQP
jgi:hypothetical protein